MDVLDDLASDMIGSRVGALGQGLLQFLELYRCNDPIDSLATLPVTVVGTLDISVDGDDAIRSWHL
jgi:hypothetical protein